MHMYLLPSQESSSSSSFHGSESINISSSDHNDSCISDNSNSNIVEELKVELHELGFDTFESSLAGCGVQWHV
jgi:hypothetical protein